MLQSLYVTGWGMLPQGDETPGFPSMALALHVKLGKSLASYRLQLPIAMLLFASAAWPETKQDHLRGVCIAMGYMKGKNVNQRYYFFYKIFI